MKEWWINLGLREKQAISIGGIFVGLFLLYEIIWAPISNKIDSMRTDIQRDQTLLTWMQQTEQHIQTLQKLSQQHSSAKTSAALLSILQKQINHSSFASNLTQLNQAENNTVQITLQKVNFDTLTKWLIELWKNQGLTVRQLTATPNGALGIVDATIVMGD